MGRIEAAGSAEFEREAGFSRAQCQRFAVSHSCHKTPVNHIRRSEIRDKKPTSDLS
jgi:hypothetical protein